MASQTCCFPKLGVRDQAYMQRRQLSLCSCCEQGLRYWMMSPLVVRKAAAAVEAHGSAFSLSSGSSSITSPTSSGTSASPPWSSSEASIACSGSSSPEETSSPRRPAPGPMASPPASPAAQAAQTLRRLFRTPRLDFKVCEATLLPLASPGEHRRPPSSLEITGHGQPGRSAYTARHQDLVVCLDRLLGCGS